MNWRLRWTWIQVAGIWQQPELRVLMLALVAAVGASSAVGLFGDRVGRAIEARSGEALGADLIITARTPPEASLLETINSLAVAQTRSIQLPSVIWHRERHELASVKSVTDGYPLKGQLRVSAGPGSEEHPTHEIPAPGEAWVDSRLWSQLGLELGSRIDVGALSLPVTRLLTYEPDRGTGFVDLAPRVLINQASLDATQLLQPGSRAQYQLLISGPPDALEIISELTLPRGTKLMTPQTARPEIRSAIQRADKFLTLAALCANLLGAVAIALCAQQYGQQLRNDVALLRCLGASRLAVTQSLGLSLAILAFLGGGLGAALGWLAQGALSGLADLLMLSSLPAPQLGGLGEAWLIALLLLGGFALPPILSATRQAPVSVFQQRSVGGNSRLWPVLALSAFAGLLLAQGLELKMLLLVGGGQLATGSLLALLAWVLLRLGEPLRHGPMRGWRLGIGNLLRRPALTLAQCVALGLGLLALLLLTVVRQDLLDSWQSKLPANTPNQFLINIQRDQIEPLRGFFAERNLNPERIWPMTRARLVQVNGQTVNADDFADPETRRWINRDFNLSWTDELGDDNTLLEGKWWGSEGAGQHWLSADTYAQERLNLELGDRLSLDFAGEQLEFEIRNFREVDWESFQPNFFLVAPPGVLDHLPATWLSSVYLPPDQRQVLRDLSRQFPNITALDLDAMMQQVRQIMQGITGALELVFLFTLAAGFMVILAAMETGRAQRRREIALLRTLGAESRMIRQALLAEFAGLGLLGGLVAALCAQGIGYALARWVFEFPYQGDWLTLLAAALASAALVCMVAWLSLRRLLSTPPDRVLRA